MTGVCLLLLGSVNAVGREMPQTPTGVSFSGGGSEQMYARNPSFMHYSSRILSAGAGSVFHLRWLV